MPTYRVAPSRSWRLPSHPGRTEESGYMNEPRAWLPIRPGGLSRRKLDGALPVSYEIQSSLGGLGEVWPEKSRLFRILLHWIILPRCVESQGPKERILRGDLCLNL